MARVFIPGLMRDLTGGRTQVQVAGATVRELIDGLEQAFPGMRERLCGPDGALHPHVMIAVDGEEVIEGLRAPVGEASEVHFLPAIAGG